MFFERLLKRLCVPPSEVDRSAFDAWTEENALDLLTRVYPDFQELIRGRDVADFGSGLGVQAVAMARAGARSVVGIEMVPALLRRSRLLSAASPVADRVSFVATAVAAPPVDVVISQNSMEHFPDPLCALGEMRSLLRPGGLALITFGPPWFAPFGHHCHYFAPVPWLNLLFPESTVMRVRRRYASDGATRYEEVQGGLNRMTLRKFELLIEAAGFVVRRKSLETVKRLPSIAGRIPVIRELLTNRVSVVLQSPAEHADEARSEVHAGSAGAGYEAQAVDSVRWRPPR